MTDDNEVTVYLHAPPPFEQLHAEMQRGGHAAVPENWPKIVTHVVTRGQVTALIEVIRQWLNRAHNRAWAAGWNRAYDSALVRGSLSTPDEIELGLGRERYAELLARITTDRGNDISRELSERARTMAELRELRELRDEVLELGKLHTGHRPLVVRSAITSAYTHAIELVALYPAYTEDEEETDEKRD